MSQVVNESVEVVVRVKPTKIEIIKFKWGDTEYMISGLTGTWFERLGGNKITHFNFICDEQGVSGELAHDHLLDKWVLVLFDTID